MEIQGDYDVIKYTSKVEKQNVLHDNCLQLDYARNNFIKMDRIVLKLFI